MAIPEPLVGLISTIVGIALPFSVLYFSLENYDTRFKEKQLFFVLLVSLVVGTILSMFHIVLGGSLAFLFGQFVLVVVGLTILELAGRESFLRARRFRGDPGMVFYGLTLGLMGFAGMMIFGRIFTYLLWRDPGLWDVLALAMFAGAATLYHGALGMEAGVRPRDEWRSVAIQFFAGLGFNTAFAIFYISLILGSDYTVILFMAPVLAAAALFRWERQRCIVDRIPVDGADEDGFGDGDSEETPDGEEAGYTGSGKKGNKSGKGRGKGRGKRPADSREVKRRPKKRRKKKSRDGGPDLDDDDDIPDYAPEGGGEVDGPDGDLVTVGRGDDVEYLVVRKDR